MLTPWKSQSLKVQVYSETIYGKLSANDLNFELKKPLPVIIDSLPNKCLNKKNIRLDWF